MSTTQELERAMGQDVYDVEGHKVGTASHLYASDVSGAPEWVTVKTGLFGSKESFVPLTGARAERDGLHVGAHKDVIKDAPRIDDNGHLSEAEAAELYRHYNLPVGTPGMGQPGMGRPGMDGQPAKHAQGKKGKDAAQGMAGQESMVRSEEQLRAGTETVETGRVRLQKHVVTEEQQVTVPVSHEEVRVVREPVAGTDPGTGKIQEDEREVVLHEERPVVAKETVAVERVGLETETIRDEATVKDTVRKERIDVDDTTKPHKH
ncbi:YsnF/AvaK domain-containing protein [Kribbella sp. NPDC051620]|uniref:YsnF/AvaK domain-containing protein n=1 Tax=Kribbella sp. NPDC051620 TaxID=3364120 RepID=UPI0037BE082E